MFTNFKKTASATLSAHAGALVMLGAVTLLQGCNMNGAEVDDEFSTTAHYDRYPIRVAQAPVKIGIASRGGVLTPAQINAVANFASQARQSASSRVAIRWSSRNPRSRSAANDIATLMIDQGVPVTLISVGSYSGGAASPIEISYQRKVAVTKECGDWSENLAAEPQNLAYRNHGCAIQNNIAAMVANPEDFQHPRAMSPSTAANRTAAMKIYYEQPAANASNASTSSGSTTTSGSGG